MKNLYVFLISFIISILIYFFLHGISNIYYAFVVAIFSSTVFIFYSLKKIYFYFSFVIIIYTLFAVTSNMLFFLQIVAVSLLIQSLLIRKLAFRDKSIKKKLELRRDLIQLLIGSFFILIFSLGFLRVSIAFVFLGIIVAFIMFFYEKKVNKIYSLLERDGVIFGSGALFMAVGAILIISFIHNFNFIFIGLFALLISDPVATITGLSFSKRLGKKSFIGSIGFFFSLLIPAVVLFGVLGILFSFILTLSENFSPVDDNLFIPILAVTISIL